MIEKIEDLNTMLRELSEQLEFDRTQIADAVAKLKEVLAGREWLTEGRGCYEWDDDRWRDEFRTAVEEFNAAIEPLQKIAFDFAGCPTTADEVSKARIDLKNKLAFYEKRHTEMQAVCNLELEKRRAAEAQLAESRITLEVTAVRFEWLHEISEEDAKAEGVSGVTYRCGFAKLWSSIHPRKCDWDANPGVWPITFRRAK